MTTRRAFAISPPICASFILNVLPSNIRGRRECRALDAPAASYAKVKSIRVSHHGHTGNTRHSPRNGFNGFLRALLGEPGLLSPSPAQCASIVANLTPASGRQDHTTLPSASCAIRQRRQNVHRIPHSTFVTIASAPLVRRDGAGL